MTTFTPKRGIGPALDEAARRCRAQRIADIRRRHYDRLGEVRHARLDGALWGEANARPQAEERSDDSVQADVGTEVDR